MDHQFAIALSRLDARIEREIHRLRARYQLSLDEFRGLYVSDEHVDRLVADAKVQGPIEVESPPTSGLTAGMREGNARWQRLVEAGALGDLDEELLLIACAPEFDPKYETLYAYLNNDITRKWATADLARRLLADNVDSSAVLAALAPAAPLQALRLIQRILPPTGRPAMLNSGFALHPCVTHWLHGHAASLALDNHAIQWLAPAELPSFDSSARKRAEPVVRVLSGWAGRVGLPPVIALIGHPGSGRTSTAVAIAAAAGRPLVFFDLDVVSQEVEVSEALERLSIALRLVPAVVLIKGSNATYDDEQRRSRLLSRLANELRHWPKSSLVLIRTNEVEQWRPHLGTRRIIEVKCEHDTFAERAQQWRNAAQSEGVEVPEVELSDFAGRYAFTSGQVRATLSTAHDLATMENSDAVSIAQIAAAARLVSDGALGKLATKVAAKHDWSDLVLPPDTLRRLREFTAAVRHRHVVYGEWGFGKRITNGTGMKALFAGSSGTGKTMAAGVIARELAIELYKIDLSGVVSKYIGETEKNLDRIFRAARSANAIVFLDEAEALMGKRSEVKDAHDRYANIEVAYLLQKLEEHDGIVILATNLKRNIDDAFSRRVQYVIDFPRPDETEREGIWRGLFPPGAPLGPDVDFAFLARQFELAGGDIRNVVLDAAFLAAQDGGVIGMSLLIEALTRQLAKEGKTPTGSEFRQYQRSQPQLAVRDGS